MANCSHCGASGTWMNTDRGKRIVDMQGQYHPSRSDYCMGKEEEWKKSQGIEIPSITNSNVAVQAKNAEVRAGKALDAALAVSTEFATIAHRFNGLASEVAKWEERLNAARKVEYEFKFPEITWKSEGKSVHPAMRELATLAQARLPAYLRGPAGSGKSTGVEMVAEMLELPFYRVGVNQDMDKGDIYGFVSPITREYQETPAYKCFFDGGVLFLDELDRGLPGSMTMLNPLADGGLVTWPDGRSGKPHKDYVLVAAGNTYGRGADSLYVGANQLDAASLDRFMYVDWDYDWELVEKITGNANWTRKVQRWHEAASRLRIKVVIGPRAAIKGAILLTAGVPEDRVAHMAVWAPIGEDHKRTIINQVGE